MNCRRNQEPCVYTANAVCIWCGQDRPQPTPPSKLTPDAERLLDALIRDTKLGSRSEIGRLQEATIPSSWPRTLRFSNDGSAIDVREAVARLRQNRTKH